MASRAASRPKGRGLNRGAPSGALSLSDNRSGLPETDLTAPGTERIHLPPAASPLRTRLLRMPRARTAGLVGGGTNGSNPLCSSGEASANSVQVQRQLLSASQARIVPVGLPAVEKGARNRLDGPVLGLYRALYKLENMDEREQSTGPIGGDPYREVAGKLREVARKCQLPRARQEILDLVERFERRATARDRRAASAGSGQTDSG
jgi:hypothetical protein